MNITVISLLDSAKAKMGGYAALLNYRYMNLSVKAEAEALLSFTVDVKADELPIEKVAQARIAPDREDQFEIYPIDKDLTIPILKGLFLAHPEYKTELVQMEGSDDPEDRYILVTVPEVDKNRHDLLMNAVGVLADTCKGQMDATLGAVTAELALKMANASPESIKEAKDAIQEVYDQYQDVCKQYRADKEQEIEDAYKQYQEKQAARQKEEEENAGNMQAGLQMKWNPSENE